MLIFGGAIGAVGFAFYYISKKSEMIKSSLCQASVIAGRKGQADLDLAATFNNVPVATTFSVFSTYL